MYRPLLKASPFLTKTMMFRQRIKAGRLSAEKIKNINILEQLKTTNIHLADLKAKRIEANSEINKAVGDLNKGVHEVINFIRRHV
jgi:hypothetical protein